MLAEPRTAEASIAPCEKKQADEEARVAASTNADHDRQAEPDAREAIAKKAPHGARWFRRGLVADTAATNSFPVGQRASVAREAFEARVQQRRQKYRAPSGWYGNLAVQTCAKTSDAVPGSATCNAK
ncbi:MAG: hypothetical protein ACO1OB_32405 [Archangium sp.]